MNLEGSSVAVLGGTRISCEIVRAAKDLGMRTVVIDYNQPSESPAKQIADEHYEVSVADIKGVSRLLRGKGIDGVITGYADSLLEWYAEICDEAGLPCYGTREQFRIFTDKGRWKRLCREFSVPTSREYDALAVSANPESFPYPLMVKPSDGSGSRGVSVVRSASELAAALEKAKDFSKSGKVVVEDYLEGPEVTAFWIAIDGAYDVFLMGDRLVSGPAEGVLPLPYGYAFPSVHLTRYLNDLAPHVREMLSSAGVRNGMLFMQCIVRDGVPFVYDIGFRLTGTLEHHLTSAVAGYSPMDMLLQYAVSGQMAGEPPSRDIFERGLLARSYNASCLMMPGTIRRFEGIDSIEAMDGVAACVKSHIEGETLPPTALGQLSQIALRVLGVCPEGREPIDMIREVHSRLRIVGADGSDLLVGIGRGQSGRRG